ncbi:transporter substrate-binding domain-containing protein [Endozoicomonas sp. SM1973]|uniref:Transporter substrate-binding domain-containing protein n=1 Tax=Spartinivicinus marinus TaxID=2994442 RepID=A0A853I609_9GAMM|nr:transporter substrate-binding domain-containing protein [Spartinivicinus marinus]MCX4030090.1 transporter substrate-binding domain-containing protein [Spartinivicinus marinus]NYZ64665.1 transporter substrate-binding domain-containing protein [Spartinivicinus marinus]
MKKMFVVLLLLFIQPALSFANIKVLRADFRERPPLMFLENSQLAGPMVDILELLAKQLNYRLVWRKVPFQKSMTDARRGLIDIIPRVSYSKERESIVHFLKPLGYRQKDTLFIVLQDSPIMVSQLETLKRFKLGVKLETSYFEALDQSAEISKTAYRSFSAMVAGLASKEVNIIAVLEQDKDQIEQPINELSLPYRYLDYKHESKIPNYFAIAKRSPHYVDRDKFDSALKLLIKSGEVKRIFDEYKAPIVF